MAVLPAAALLAGVVLSGVAPTVARAQSGAETIENAKDWLATLRTACPERQLDGLNPGLLIDEIIRFRNGLPSDMQERMERLAQADLNLCELGAGCANSAYIRAAAKMGLMRRMAFAVCAGPWTCTAPFTCRDGAN